MPRSREFDVDAAIEFAMNEMWLRGYAGVSVKYLCEELGITRSSFYNAFGSLDGLFELALEKYLDRAPEAALFAMTPETPFKSTVTRVIREICRVRGQDPQHRGCFGVNSMNELLASDQPLGVEINSLATSFLSKLEELIRWAKARSELPKSIVERELALALNSFMIGLSTQSKFLGSEKELWKSAKTSLKALDLYEEA